ncbi:MAG TPA: ABC transporter substrate-binding protein [Desulfobulbus sp.]|nr:ABC transporter substrate-binding protein [Desulfobulbus sp.]
MKRLPFLSLFLLLFLVPVSGRAATTAVPDPTAQMRPFVAKITNLLRNEDFKNDPKCERCQKIIDIAKEHFDFREMSKRVLGRQWRRLSPEQKDKFVTLFTRLLQYAYIGKIKDYAGQQVEFTGQRIRGRRAEVKTLLVDRDKTIPVSYIMLLKGDQWMTYDVVVEGVSLVRNYMEQFREILRRDKYAGLLKKLEEKVKQLEQEKLQEATKPAPAG